MLSSSYLINVSYRSGLQASQVCVAVWRKTKRYKTGARKHVGLSLRLWTAVLELNKRWYFCEFVLWEIVLQRPTTSRAPTWLPSAARPMTMKSTTCPCVNRFASNHACSDLIYCPLNGSSAFSQGNLYRCVTFHAFLTHADYLKLGGL